MKLKTKVLIYSIMFILIINISAYAINFPQVSANSYIVIDKETSRIIASRNSNRKMPMASTTKIMTALVALEEILNIDNEVIVPDYCTNIEGSSIYLKPNQQISLKDLLYGLMLRSGNDAAMAVANYVGGKDIDTFIEKMNMYANKLGAYNTHFENPHGLHHSNHYTTAYDLAIITKYALSNDKFKEIVSSKKYKSENTNALFYNKNKVVLNYKYGTGVKIGYTRKSGRCISASAEKDGVEIIVVLLDANNWFNDCYKLFDWAFSNYQKYNIIQYEQYFLQDNNLTGCSIVADNEFNYLLKQDELEKIQITCNELPFITNDSIEKYFGYYTVKIDDRILNVGNLKYK